MLIYSSEVVTISSAITYNTSSTYIISYIDIEVSGGTLNISDGNIANQIKIIIIESNVLPYTFTLSGNFTGTPTLANTVGSSLRLIWNTNTTIPGWITF